MRARSFCALLPLFACTHPPASGPTLPPDEPTPVERPAGVATADAGTDATASVETSTWQLVVDSVLLDLHVVAFDRFAAITSRSLFLIVDGENVRQEPRFLDRLPEWINWDASGSLDLPRTAKMENGLPLGSALSMHAGNRHGPGFTEWWTKNGWSTRPPQPDPRFKKLPKPASAFVDTIDLALPSGELVVVRYDSEIESFVFPANGGPPARSVVPSAPGIRHLLLGDEADDLYLCETSQAVLHFDGKEWSPIETERAPSSCARTRDGALWLVVDARGNEPATVLVQRGSDTTEVALPAGAIPEEIAAAEARVWVSASRREPQRYLVFSNEKVREPVTLDESSLPGPVWINGITGLDVTSVDVVSVSGNPAGPGTSACTSLVAWLGPKLTPELEKALGSPRPRLVETAGIEPGSIAPSANGNSDMIVVPSGKKRSGVAALPKSHAEGRDLVERVHAALPGQNARLVCALPRIVREL